MRAYSAYVKQLTALVREASLAEPPVASLNAEVEAALNGQPASELRRLIELDEQRAAGAFFTGTKLAKRAVSRLMTSVKKGSIILDPACGVGDLLVACTEHFQLSRTFTSTIQAWSNQLLGFDLEAEFVQAARQRLLLAAINRNVRPSATELSAKGFFHGLHASCGLAALATGTDATHIVLNPPFTMMPSPEDCEWGEGSISSAAWFLDRCVEHSNSGTRIAAILPEVLRSGVRYERWRRHIAASATIDQVRLAGQFDPWADVDVFILDLLVSGSSSKKRNPWLYPGRASTQTVEEVFDVSVGPVVPFRDRKTGPKRLYIHARSAPAWKSVSSIAETRKYKGTTYESPFVVIRRTSRRGDRFRAVGTIVNVPSPVAVENHLLVLQPRDGKVKTCRRLLKILESERMNDWVNQRIRCRHLTVKAVKTLPWWEE